MSEKKCEGIESYEIEAWISQLGSFPRKVVETRDNSESYEMHRAHILLLEDKKYALVTESGCSCYSSEDANVDLYPTLREARKKFEEWFK